MNIDPAAMQQVFDQLLAAYGPQQWWPADSRFEVFIGAVLVQNTAWINAERAIVQLRAQTALTAEGILALPSESLAQQLLPAGYYNVKSRRLVNLCDWFLGNGGFDRLDGWTTLDLRAGLLSVSGVGPETADAILLYAFDRPIFVSDAYAHRILGRLGWLSGPQNYESLRAAVENAAPRDAGYFNELHALLVQHGKVSCKPRPKCGQCVLQRQCLYAKQRLSE